MRSIVESNELGRLRERYLNRRLWAYGGLRPWREWMRPQSGAESLVGFDEPFKIVRIYQLEKAPLELGHSGDIGGLLIRWSYETKDLGKESPFLLVYAVEDRSIVNRRLVEATDPRLYGPPYHVLVGDWTFDRLFSLKPPPPSIVRFLRRRSARAKGGDKETYLKGMTRFQAAWALGWPLVGRPSADHPTGERASIWQLMQNDVWEYGDYYYIMFKRDRVDRYFEASMH